jgi:hypothetical protein
MNQRFTADPCQQKKEWAGLQLFIRRVVFKLYSKGCLYREKRSLSRRSAYLAPNEYFMLFI